MQINPVAFGKTYISKTPVRNLLTGEKEMFDFVEYDDVFEDKSNIEKAQKKWTYYINFIEGIYKTNYGEEIYNDFLDSEYRPQEHYFGLEDKNGEIQALCEVIENQKGIEVPITVKKQPNPLEILFFMVNPKNGHKSNNRKYSKIGTSFFKEIVNYAKNKNHGYIALSDASHGFWCSLPSLETGKPKYFTEKTKFLRGSKFDICTKKLDKRI